MASLKKRGNAYYAQYYVGDKRVQTGSLKVGSFIGDHTKTSIGTLLNTGTVAGIMCNLVAGPSLMPKAVPSFCWYYHGSLQEGRGLEDALGTARASMSRRHVDLTSAMVELIKYTEGLTQAERTAAIERARRK